MLANCGPGKGTSDLVSESGDWAAATYPCSVLGTENPPYEGAGAHPDPEPAALRRADPDRVDRHAVPRPAPPSPATVGPRLRAIFIANLVAQIAIVLTGGLVRLTGSGLGCPTWPECVPGSVLPVPGQAQAFHKWIEFGNRMLTSVLVFLAIAALLGALQVRKRWRTDGSTPRPGIFALATIPILGTVAQALLGGLTVLTGLHPATVSAHFLLSMAIIAGCVVLVDRSSDSEDSNRGTQVAREIRILSAVLLANVSLVLVLGTIVTGTGPHSGDSDTSVRLSFDLRSVAWLHADAVMLFLGLLVGLILALRVTDSPPAARRWAQILLALSLTQGTIGYLQWFNGVPWVLVAIHILLACLVWTCTVFLFLSLSRPKNQCPSRSTNPDS